MRIKQHKMGEVHDTLTGTTTALHNAICSVEQDPSTQNKKVLRKILRQFQNLGGHLAYYAYEALQKKKSKTLA